jgi:RNA polymerase sigma-70 factor (ECF subfamily)
LERLRDSSGLAFSIAYGVLRNRSDAEEVAQDAFARAFRRFRQLRDRDRFRSWLTRMTWRLAIDRWRTDRRRTARELATALEPWGPSTEQQPDNRTLPTDSTYDIGEVACRTRPRTDG